MNKYFIRYTTKHSGGCDCQPASITERSTIVRMTDEEIVSVDLGDFERAIHEEDREWAHEILTINKL
jgi:hypothetical protein